MPKVRRTPPPEHVVVVDTNILWDKDKKFPVTPVFDQFWTKNSPLIPMRLNVPEVVLGELQFQQTTSAIKALITINDTYAELSGITSSTYSHKCNETTVKTQVKAKLERWLKTHSGVVVPTPIAQVDWSNVVECAIWRKPPFTFDPKDPKNEKGFRDALILETLAHTCGSAGATKTVIFVSNDYLLRSAAEARLKSSKRFLAFESLSDFEAYIGLTQQQLTNSFVKSIQGHARSKFYTKGDSNSIYFKHDILGRVTAEHPSALALQAATTNALSLLGQGVGPSAAAAKLVRQFTWIRSTQFSKLSGTREFHWVSRIEIARLFELEPPPGLIAAAMHAPRRLQVAGFDVSWKANVKLDGRFHDILIDSIEHKETKQLDPTDESLQQWKLA